MNRIYPKIKKYNRLFLLIEAGIILLAIFGLMTLAVEAQPSNQWSPQAKIPVYEELTEEPPFLVADQNHTVHAFNSQPLDLEEEGSPRAVVYRQWTLEGGWTEPIDIILNPGGDNLNLMDVYVDQMGMVHLVLQMNLEDIYYTQAPLVYAGRASAWSVPVFLGGQAIPARPGIPHIAAITGNNDNNLVVIYSGVHHGNGLYVVYSTDNGHSWTEPTAAHLTYDTDLIVTSPRLHTGQSGQTHVVWSTFHDDGEGGPGYYASIELESKEWSNPVSLDPTPSIRTPNVIEYDNQIIVSYYNGNVNGNWWRHSTDGGLTWSAPVRISPLHKGTNGIVYFVVDSSDTLHLLFGERIDDNNHGLWHSIWNGSRWTDPLPVVRGPQVKDEVGGKGFDPRSARAVISNGNVLLTSWGTDGAAGSNGAWYAYTILDTPELPAVALPLPSPTPTIEAIPTATSSIPEETPPPTKRVVPNVQSNSADAVSRNPGSPLVISLIPVVLFISAVIVIRQLTNLFNRR